MFDNIVTVTFQNNFHSEIYQNKHVIKLVNIALEPKKHSSQCLNSLWRKSLGIHSIYESNSKLVYITKEFMLRKIKKKKGKKISGEWNLARNIGGLICKRGKSERWAHLQENNQNQSREYITTKMLVCGTLSNAQIGRVCV
jgi:hypothetical protein